MNIQYLLFIMLFTLYVLRSVRIQGMMATQEYMNTEDVSTHLEHNYDYDNVMYLACR